MGSEVIMRESRRELGKPFGLMSTYIESSEQLSDTVRFRCFLLPRDYPIMSIDSTRILEDLNQHKASWLEYRDARKSDNSFNSFGRE